MKPSAFFRVLRSFILFVTDAESRDVVQPDSLFRWCSMSKTVTAAAIMRLAEQNKLDLDQAIFSILDQFTPYHGGAASAQPREYGFCWAA